MKRLNELLATPKMFFHLVALVFEVGFISTGISLYEWPALSDLTAQ